jgi:membrane protein
MTGRTATHGQPLDDARTRVAEEVPTDPRDASMGVGRRLITSIREDDVSGLGAEMAYRFLFAVFPFGLFVAALSSTVAAWLRLESPADQIIAGLGDNLPPAVADAIQPELERLFSSASNGLLLTGALLALWAATGGTNALVKGIHRAYGVPEQRPFLLRYAIAVGLTLLGAVGVIASFVTIVGGAMATQEVADRLGLGAQAWTVVQLLRWPAVFLVLTIAVAILYRYAPSVVIPWRWIAVGAAAFSLGWLVATAALGWYAGNVADYGATYGSLGAVIVLMLWFYVSAVLLLVGAEISAALTRERSPDEIRRRGEEQAVAEAVDDVTEHATERVRSATDRSA